jgi:hypothetical protein
VSVRGPNRIEPGGGDDRHVWSMPIENCRQFTGRVIDALGIVDHNERLNARLETFGVTFGV